MAGGITFEVVGASKAVSNLKGRCKTGKERTLILIRNDCLRYMMPYMPMRSTALQKSAVIATAMMPLDHMSAGNTPYARRNYVGLSKNGKELHFNGAPMRGKLWFRRMWADKREVIMKNAQKAMVSK